MLRLLIPCLLLGLVAAAPLSAKTFQLTYEGRPFTLNYFNPIYGPYDFPPERYSGTVVLDGTVFGDDLSDKTINFFGIADDGVTGPVVVGEGLIAWKLNIPLFSAVGTTVSFTFGRKNTLVSWNIDASDGPPDYRSRTDGDEYYTGSSWVAPPGIWRVGVIPLPPSMTLLLAATAALAGLSLRRKA